MRPSILTIESEYFDFTAPHRNRYTIKCIAHALAHVCRFGGHCKRFYSVAEHCVRMSYIVPPEHALAALLHEIGEAFTGDMTAPLKMLCPEFKRIEKSIEADGLLRFGLEPILPACIKYADAVLLSTEQRDLMNHGRHEMWKCPDGIAPLPKRIRPWPIFWARWRFGWRFNELMRERAKLAREEVAA